MLIPVDVHIPVSKDFQSFLQEIYFPRGGIPLAQQSCLEQKDNLAGEVQL